MALPLRSKNPPDSFPVATVLLIVVNVFVFALTVGKGMEIRESVVVDWASIAGRFSLLRSFTAMFLHLEPFHLLGNMWFLYLFGFAVEGRLRWYRYVPLYLLSGIGGDLLTGLFSKPGGYGIGASGAIMGVVGAAIWIFPHAKIVVLSRLNRWFGGAEPDNWLFPTADWSMWVVALYFLGLDLVYQLVFSGADGVGHLAHLGGALVGFLVAIAFRTHRDSETASESKATLAEVKDLSVLRRMELAELHLGNPDDALIVLHWMDKSLREPQPPTGACLDAFFKALPKMRREMDPRTLVGPILGLASTGRVKAREIVSIAGDLERAGDAVNAMRLYEVAYGAPDATDAEQETACFRTGLICENVVHDRDRALNCYAEVVHRWPMGSFGPQAESRIKGLHTRAKV